MNKVVGIFVINLHGSGDFAFAEDLDFVARRVGENVNLVWLLRKKTRINTEKNISIRLRPTSVSMISI